MGRKLRRIIAVTLSNIGFEPARILSLRFLLRFLRERRTFSRKSGSRSHWHPILTDYLDSAGVMSGHYYHQDLLVAQSIFRANPRRHIDVGSRIDGFVAHLASFREVEVLDIRDVQSKSVNITFRQHDFMGPIDFKTDSLSCLHTIEHFGLGRYGDPIDPEGHLKGFQNLVGSMLTGGFLYISFPIAKIARVEFNAHRVFNPLDILEWPGSEKVKLQSFSFVDDEGDLHSDVSLDDVAKMELTHGCGIYTFKRL